MDKSEKKRLKKEFQNNEKTSFESSLPMPRQMFKKLFNYLDKQSGKRECGHDLSMTKEFLKKNNIPEKPVVDWLEENGGFCDCEVIFNVEELFEE